jgi:hypothetical protein
MTLQGGGEEEEWIQINTIIGRTMTKKRHCYTVSLKKLTNDGKEDCI